MANRYLQLNRICLGVIALTAWFAVGIQAYITVDGLHNFIFFISFFTVLTNILVALGFSVLLLFPSSKSGRYFGRPGTLAAITLYILVVGLVYNTILRQLWHPQGLQLLADNLLHVAVPALVLLYWIFMAPKNNLQWTSPFVWLWYPGLYLVYTLIRGALTGEYPYPFIDAAALGYPAMLVNAGGMLLLFIAVGCLFTAFGKWQQKRHL